MLNRKAILLSILLLTVFVPIVKAQDTTPTFLSITVYSDGSAKAIYLLDAEPTQVRVNVELFGPPFNNLVIRDEEGNPLVYTANDSNVTIDSIGALELNIQYITSSLTAKYSTLWELNITAPAETRITLPLGASIVDFMTAPKNIGVVDGKSYLDFEAGEISIYYILGLPSIAVDASESINDANDYITIKTAEGYILSAAASLLTQAETLYIQNEYLEAKNLADSAYIQAQNTVSDADSASTALQRAMNAITDAEDEKRTINLDAAESAYESAASLYAQGDYSEAETVANQAYQLALQAEASSGGNTLLYAGLLVILLAAAGGGYLFIQKNKDIMNVTSHVKPPVEIDLDKIFDEHDLRLEDREVIRYIADHQGEVFASEIRDRFEMPRSTTWRLIQRLKDYEIIDEVKIGNQSLLRIIAKYHKGGD